MPKKYNSRQDAIHDVLLQDLLDFLISHREDFNACEHIKIYYDNGQVQVTSILKEASAIFSSKVEVVSGSTRG